MYLVLGATGHVGSATADALLDAGRPVTVAVHDAAKGEAWRRRGAAVVTVDVHDVDGLRHAFRGAKRAFLLNPPADTSTDTDAEERATVRCIVAALDGSGLQKVVAESTMGAQPGEALGDLSVLYEFEQGLQAQAIPCAIIRAAYYMSNWDELLAGAREHGELPTMLPPELGLPMVAPVDLGREAAALLMAPIGETGIRYVEGPERYTASDVAAAFAEVLGQPVRLRVTPRGEWESAFRSLGFSAAAARSYARMTAVTVDAEFEDPAQAIHGTTSLREHVRRIVERG